MKISTRFILLFCSIIGLIPLTKAQINVNFIGRYSTGIYNSGGGVAEISAYDASSKRMFVINGPDTTLRIVNIANPANPIAIATIDIRPYGIDLTSVACNKGRVAVSVIDSTGKTANCKVVFFNINGAFINQVRVGANPDNVVFTPDGKKLLVANEGEPNVGYTIDPEGSISIIDVSGPIANLTQANVQTATFTAFNSANIDPRIRIFGRIQTSGGAFLRNSTVAEDLEPEYITISDDNSTAWVTCQENNCMAVVNINTATVTSLWALGFKNHNLSGNALDPSDQSGPGGTPSISIANWPVFGMYQPDGVASYTIGGQRYLVTANEGDARADWGAANVEEVRLGVATYVLDTTKFGGPSGVAALKANAGLGRLNVSNRMGDNNNDGRFDSIFTFGARSFSIWNASTGALVYDSKDEFEQRTATLFPNNFNTGHTTNTLDDRSDNKGPEPESVVIGKILDSTYAFIGLERIGGIMVYNITNPAAPYFVQYINTRNFSVTPSQANLSTVGDLGPEGITFIPREESPIGKDMILLSNEVSGSVAMFEVNSPAPNLTRYENLASNTIGTYQGMTVRESGFSSLYYIPGTNPPEFFTNGDRGPNIDAGSANCATGIEKIFPFPSYTPKIFRIRLNSDNTVSILQTIPIRKPDGTNTTGLPMPAGLGNAGEIAWSDTTGACPINPSKVLGTDPYGIDPEGIVMGGNYDFWVSEEYGASVWNVDANGLLKKRYTPFAPSSFPSSANNARIDSILRFRTPNRGFEGLARTPNGRIYAFMQSPMANPNSTAGNASRIHRILEINPANDSTRLFAYVNPGAIGTSNDIRTRDWKIGDAVAINNNEFLVIEHAARGNQNLKRIFRVSIAGATPIVTENYGTVSVPQTLEQLIDSNGLASKGIVPVTKTLFLDLMLNNWPASLDKPEGLAIINDSTIAVCNDNDFGLSSPAANGIVTPTNINSNVFLYTVRGSQKISGFVQQTPSAPYQLQVLHSSDMESGLDAVTDAPNFAAVLDTLEGTYPNTVRLASGDCYIPGPFLSAGEDISIQTPLRNTASAYYPGATSGLRPSIGRVDMAMMNIMGFQASALGNHEFDLGTTEVNNIIGVDIRSNGTDKRWVGAQFPYLSANLNFSNDINLSYLYTNQRLLTDSFRTSANITANSQKKGIAPSSIINVNGERIGLVGATTQVLASIASPGATTVIGPGNDNMPALAAILQPVIDSLRSMGINKIILMSHLQQLSNEKALAPLLRGVDIIIAGGSHTLCADGNDRIRPGIPVGDRYPIMTTNIDNEPLAILNTTSEWKYIGRFVASFDNNGVLIPNLMDSTINGAYAADTAMVTQLWGNYNNAFATGTKANLVRQLTVATATVINNKDGNRFGKASVFLEGRRNFVRTEETNLGNVTADANLWMARRYDPTVRISIKNGGGIRSAIGFVNAVGSVTTLEQTLANPSAGKARGDISQLDIENSLRFNNRLSILSLNAAGLKRIAEHAISATTPNATPGQFPQIAGMSFSYDTTRSIGNRIWSLVITDSVGTRQDTIVRNGVLAGDTSRVYKLVTLDFLAGGGDNYPFIANGFNRINLDTAIKDSMVARFAANGTEQDAFAEYMVNRFNTSPYAIRDTSMQGDRRIQLLNVRPDAIFPETNPATTILAARNTAAPNTVRVRGVVTRAWGRFIYIQDATAGIGIRQSSGALVDSITSGGLREGDSVEVIGPRNDFNNYAQIQLVSGAYNSISTVIKLASNRTLNPIQLTVKQLNNNGEIYESELVRITGLRTSGTGNFAASTNYTVWDGTTPGDSIVLRVIASQDTELDDAPVPPVPTGTFTFEGILAQFCSSPTSGCASGYQLYGVRKRDIIATLNPFTLSSPATNTRLITSPTNTSPINITWNRSGNAVRYRWILESVGGTFASGLFSSLSNNNGADTVYTLTVKAIDSLLNVLNVKTGDSINTQWSVRAYGAYNDSLLATTPFNIKLVREKAFNLFALLSPANNASVTVNKALSAPINISWQSSQAAVSYEWLARTTTGSFNSPLLSFASNNSGKDTVLSITHGFLDNLLQSLGKAKGDSITLVWTVYAFRTPADSMKAITDFSVTLIRKRNLTAFTLTSPANNANLLVDTTILTPVVITWGSSVAANKYNVLFDRSTGNFSTPLAVWKSDNNGADTKLTLSHSALDQLLASASVSRGDSINLKWTVKAFETTEDSIVASPFAINMKRRAYNVGLFTVNSLSQTKVYPNPTSGIFYIDIPSLTETVEVIMTDITGKVIYSNHHKENRIQVDANSFHTGLYFVTIKTGDYAKTIKLIKE